MTKTTDAKRRARTAGPAKRLRQARIAAGYVSAAKAAEALEMNYQTYAGHENNKSGFRNESAVRYAEFFSVSLEWLLTNRGRPPKVQPPRADAKTDHRPIVRAARKLERALAELLAALGEHPR